MLRTPSARILGVVAILVILLTGVAPASSTVIYPGQVLTEGTTSEITLPDAPGSLKPGGPIPAAKLAALQQKVYSLREQYDARVDNHVGERTRGLASSSAGETRVEGADQVSPEYLQGPSAVFMMNKKNVRANTTVATTLAEPSAINEGKYIFAAGNTHAEYSIDRGTTWTAVGIPAGPMDAPMRCCDLDVVYDRSRGLTIWSVLYTNTDATNGAVRIYVRRTVNALTNACSYTIDPAGTADNTVPDYPHLGLSNNYLYLSMNLLGGAAGSQAQVRRLRLDDLGECVGAGTDTYSYPWTYGQRAFVPAEGALDTMYWGALVNSSTFRIYSWADNSSSVLTVDRTVSPTNFVDSDCRGGINNVDFIVKETSWSITGFRLRGAVGRQGLLFLWDAGADANHPQAYIRGALFSESDLTLIGQPDIYNTLGCFGYPAVGVNDRGDFGLSVAYGGRAGGGGSAAQGYVGIDDEFTLGAGVFQNLYLTASGNYNRPDGRYGDYMTVRRQSPCGLYFAATSYSLLDGIALANVNSRYVEFGRGRDYKCWRGWSPRVRAP